MRIQGMSVWRDECENGRSAAVSIGTTPNAVFIDYGYGRNFTQYFRFK